MSEENKRKCMSCEIESDSVVMFEGRFFDSTTEIWEKEVYCNKCLANIFLETPEDISELEQI